MTAENTQLYLQRLILFLLCASLFLFSQHSQASNREVKITVLYTGDTYGYQGYPGFPGGFAKRKVAIDKIRKSQPNVLLLDSGNSLGPFFYARLDRGELASLMMSKLSYSAINLGVHEFDYGKDHILKLAEKSSLPVLSTNIFKENGEPFSSPEIKTTVGGLQVVILGICDPKVHQKVLVGQFAGLRVKDPIETLKEKVRQWRPKADLIIVLANLGYYETQHIAKEVPGIDTIVSRSKGIKTEFGHNQGDNPFEFTKIQSTKNQKRDTIVLTSSRYAYHLGRLDFLFKRGADGNFFLTKASPSVISLPVEYAEDPAFKKKVAERIEFIETKYDKAIAKNIKETFGDHFDKGVFTKGLLSLMKKESRSEIATINETAFFKPEFVTDSVRKQNEIKAINLHHIFWPDNHIVKAVYSGKQLKQIFEQGKGLLLYEGLTESKGDIFVNGRPISDDEEYTMATTNYLINPDSPVPAMEKSIRLSEKFKKRRSRLKPSKRGDYVLVRDLMIERLDKVTLTHKKSAYPPQLHILFDQLTFNVSNFDVRNNANFTNVRESRLQSVDQLTIGTSGRLEFQYDSRSVDWFNGVNFRFLRLEFENNVINNPLDNISIYSQANAKGLGFNVTRKSRIVPFINVSYLTEFTAESPNPRNKIFNLATGLTTTWGGVFKEMRIGPAFNFDFSLPDNNHSVGFNFQYRLGLPLSKSGIILASELYFHYFPYYETDRADSFLYTLDARNSLQVPIIGYFYLSPQVELFAFRGKAVKETATNLLLGIGITYTRLWKPSTQPFIP